jgi:hypothetical protein
MIADVNMLMEIGVQPIKRALLNRGYAISVKLWQVLEQDG